MSSTERLPLLSSYKGALIASYIQNNIILEKRVPEGTFHCITRRSLQGLSAVVGVAARIPFLRITLAYAGTNPWGITLTACSAVSFGSVVSWCLLNLIGANMRPLTNEEKGIIQSNLQGWKFLAVTTTVIFMGTIAQVPLGFMAYIYNNKNILFPIGVVCIDSAYPIYSLHLSMEELLKKRDFTPFEKQLNQLRRNIIQEFEQILCALTELTPEEQDRFVSELKRIKSMQENPEQLNQYLNLLFIQQRSPQPIDNRVIRVGRYSVVAFSGVLTIAQLIFCAVLGYKGTEAVTDNKPACYTFAVFIVLCNLYLNYSVMIGTSVKSYNLAVSYIRKTPTKTLVSKLNPKISICLKLIAFAISVLSYAGPVKVCQDYFSGPLSIFMQVATAVATILLSINAMTLLVDDIIALAGKGCGGEIQKELLKLDMALKGLIYTLEKSSLIEFVKFLKILPFEKVDNLLSQLKIQQQAIEDYTTSNYPVAIQIE